MDEIRKAFEAWFVGRDVMAKYELKQVTDDGSYFSPFVEAAWHAWQAATLAERERAARLLLDDASAMTYQSLGQYRTAMAKAIRGN